jgi:peptidoglycan/xylan/chitin deacetylase (PgdA/CDA1 family)
VREVCSSIVSRIRCLTALLIVVALGGCRDTATASAPSGTPAAPAPAASQPATAAPTHLIALADPRAGRVAGAEIGPAEPLPAADVLALPPPTGRGAVPRGTLPVVHTHGPADRKRMALTFDSNMTDAMLKRLAAGQVRSYANTAVVDELQQSHTPATFFLAGKWVQAYPALTRRIAADPAFEIASHSWAHEGFRAGCYGLGTIAPAGMAADVERSFEILGQYTDHASRYFRFPGGCYDRTALEAIAPTGCTVVEFDDVSGDAFGSGPAAIADHTVKQARPGSIAVLHITEANAKDTARALPAIIARLRAAGYDLVTVGDLLAG